MKTEYMPDPVLTDMDRSPWTWVLLVGEVLRLRKIVREYGCSPKQDHVRGTTDFSKCRESRERHDQQLNDLYSRVIETEKKCHEWSLDPIARDFVALENRVKALERASETNNLNLNAVEDRLRQRVAALEARPQAVPWYVPAPIPSYPLPPWTVNYPTVTWI